MKKQWDEFWKGISTTDAELNKFLQEGGFQPFRRKDQKAC